MGCQFSRNNISPDVDLWNSQFYFSSKTLLLGEIKVGKTSLANRLCNNRFKDDYMVTIGGTFLQKKYLISSHELIYNLWDCCGDERFSSLLPIIWKDANAVIFVYDVANRESFKKISFWRKNLLELMPPGNLVQGLVGNKSDLIDKSVVCNEAKQYADENEMFFQEMSAKNGEGIDYFFYGFAEKILKHLKFMKTTQSRVK